jgi:preprotein translocase subunit SecY
MMTILTMTAGSCFVMWLGEQITERGIGNGASLIITCGIIAAMPLGALRMFQQVRMGEVNLLFMTLLLGFMFAVVAAIVFIERGQRRIQIQYAKRVIGRRVYGGQSTHLPLKVNTAGVIPPIFASSFLMFPATLGTFFDNAVFDTLSTAFLPGAWLYNLTFVALIIFFSYFYTAITFNPVDVADNLKRHGGYIPKVRPGKDTADEIEWLLTRLTAGGAVYLAGVCMLPTLLIANYNVPFYFGGTGLLIIVGVCLQTVAEVEALLLTRHYDGAMDEGSQRARHRRALEREKKD